MPKYIFRRFFWLFKIIIKITLSIFIYTSNGTQPSQQCHSTLRGFHYLFKISMHPSTFYDPEYDSDSKSNLSSKWVLPILADIDLAGSLRSMNGPWSNDWALNGCRGRHTFICYVLHSCRTPAREVWPLQVATLWCAPYFDNVQSVLLQSNNIFSSHSKMQELQRDSSPTGTIITKQILALLLDRPQRGRDCAKVNALEISSIYYLWTINWSPGDKKKKRKKTK